MCFKLLLLDTHSLHHPYRSLNLIFLIPTTARLNILLADETPRFCLIVRETQLSFGPSDLLDQLTLIVGLPRDHLSAEVLNLGHKLRLDRFLLLTHDRSPNAIELVQDLGDGDLT